MNAMISGFGFSIQRRRKTFGHRANESSTVWLQQAANLNFVVNQPGAPIRWNGRGPDRGVAPNQLSFCRFRGQPYRHEFCKIVAARTGSEAAPLRHKPQH